MYTGTFEKTVLKRKHTKQFLKEQKQTKWVQVGSQGEGGVNNFFVCFSTLGPLGLQMGAWSAQSHRNGAPRHQNGAKKSQKLRQNTLK